MKQKTGLHLVHSMTAVRRMEDAATNSYVHRLILKLGFPTTIDIFGTQQTQTEKGSNMGVDDLLSYDELVMFTRDQLAAMAMAWEKKDWEAYRYEERLMLKVIVHHVASAKTNQEVAQTQRAAYFAWDGMLELAKLKHGS